MVKIIEAGNIERTKPWWTRGEWKCHSCLCIWQAEEGDVVRITEGQRNDETASMPCPTCGREAYRTQ